MRISLISAALVLLGFWFGWMAREDVPKTYRITKADLNAAFVEAAKHPNNCINFPGTMEIRP